MNFIAIGRQAHANGDMAAPGLNAHVRRAIENLPVGSPLAMQAMTDFTKGYNQAVDAEVKKIMEDLQ